MRKFFTLLSSLALAVLPLLAQDVDESFVFIDENGNVIEDGSVVVRNVVEEYDAGVEVIYSGIKVRNVSAVTSDYIKMIYIIEQLDNGSYQICFPTTCNKQTQEGYYETSIGQLMGTEQNIESEWFPTADGSCIVTLSIEVLTKSGGFPPVYNHKAFGPTITVQFVKGGTPPPEPLKGDVNGDGEVGISDVNTLIDMILSSAPYSQPADVNGDGEIGISDVNAVLAIILNPASAA